MYNSTHQHHTTTDNQSTMANSSWSRRYLLRLHLSRMTSENVTVMTWMSMFILTDPLPLWTSLLQQQWTMPTPIIIKRNRWRRRQGQGFVTSMQPHHQKHNRSIINKLPLIKLEPKTWNYRRRNGSKQLIHYLVCNDEAPTKNFLTTQITPNILIDRAVPQFNKSREIRNIAF